MTRLKISAVIPAYNEKGRVGRVAHLAVHSGLFDEVIVVVDGATDGTEQELRGIPGLKLRVHSSNLGKGRAMQTGFNQAIYPVVCFLDADLIDITARHLELLIDPVVHGKVEATLAVFAGGRKRTTFAQKINQAISGQRCLLKSLLSSFNEWESGYGVETAIEDHLKRLGIPRTVVRWSGASQVTKEEKMGLFWGTVARIVMFWEIWLAWVKTVFGWHK